MANTGKPDGRNEENCFSNTLTNNIATKLGDDLKTSVHADEQYPISDEIAELTSEIYKLQENVRYTLDPFWQHIKNEMFDIKCYVKQREEEIKKLQSECQSQKIKLKNAEADVKTIRNMLYEQSSFTISFGATLSGLLWKASKEPHIVQTVMIGSRMNDFFRTVCESLNSFFETYSEELPDFQSDEVQFIISLLGIVANVAAVKEGREFLLTSNDGQDLIRKMIADISKIPSSGICIQRIALMALFNVSISKCGGTILIETDPSFLKFLAKNIFDHLSELKFISLKLLQSLTFEITNPKSFAVLFDVFTELRLKEENYIDEELEMITEITENIQSAKLQLQNLQNLSSTLNDEFE